MILVLILVQLVIKRRYKERLSKITSLANNLIQEAIFVEDITEISSPGFLKNYAELLKNKEAKDILVAELLFAKKNISGEATAHLIYLYNHLKLSEHAFSKLKSCHWYVQAKGIQEIATMELMEHIDKVNHFINNKHEEVRLEAETAILQLRGFDGLDFLNTIAYPLSDWQQIKLLKELSQVQITETGNIDNWLRSSNNSVIIFTLRIIRNHHIFSKHNQVAACLSHSNKNVRLQAILTLREIYTENTVYYLKEIFETEGETNKLAIIHAIEAIGTPADVPFLLNYVNSEHKTLVSAILKAIAAIDLKGFNNILTFIDDFPFPNMLLQVKQELKI